ncbi:AI-2E family transporter [Alkaliphilus crotonatoxidans]
MKLKLDQRYFKYSLYAFFTVAMSIIFYLLLNNLGYYMVNARIFLQFIRRILSPFIIGSFVAYLLNPAVRWFEGEVYIKVASLKQRKRLLRLLSVVTVYLIMITSITMLIVVVAPQIGNNISDLIRSVPEYVTSTTNVINRMVEDIENFSSYNISAQIDSRIRLLFDDFTSILEKSLSNLFSSIYSITSGLLNVVLGLIISFYMLMDKESFKLGIEKLLRVVLKDETVERVKNFGREVDDLFAKFIVGKSLDSFIIGCLCFIGLSLMGLRYTLLISVIIMVTNMIPYFGPFIGAVPAVIITLFYSPINAFWLSIFIFALQQFDGLILGPKILGDSVGVSPFWIILAITVGGKLFGVLGMFLGVPVIAIIRLVINRFIDRQLERKKLRVQNKLNEQSIPLKD